jgi:hypothetical protein
VLALRLVLGGGNGVAEEQPGPDSVGHVLARTRPGKGKRCNRRVLLEIFYQSR